MSRRTVILLVFGTILLLLAADHFLCKGKNRKRLIAYVS